ncbi:MAG: Fe-S cluster assembly protein SufD, partial [Curtobacterium sp.]
MSSTTPPHIDQPIEPAAAAQGGTQHGAGAHSDGGWDVPGAKVPVQTRSERPQSGDIDAFPTVTGREVNWKFAPLAKLQPLLDGGLDGSAYPFLARQSDGADVEWGRSDDPRVGTAGLPEDRAAAAAWTARDAVLAVTVKATEAYEFITITRSDFGTQPRAAHTVITAEAHAQGIVVLDNRGSALLSENVEIVVRD